MTFSTLPVVSPATQQPARIVLMETRPVLDVTVPVDSIATAAKVTPDTNLHDALTRWNIAKDSTQQQCAGKIINQARWFDGNAVEVLTNPYMNGQRLEPSIVTLSGDRSRALQADFDTRLSRKTEDFVSVPASGNLRYNVISATTGNYLFKNSDTLYLNQEQETAFLALFEDPSYLEGAKVLCVTGISDERNLHLIEEIQLAAARSGIKLIVDAKGESLKTYFENAKGGKIYKLTAAKPNLEEFCELVELMYGTVLDARGLSYHLKNGRIKEFEKEVLPWARTLANDCIASGGHLIITCGEHPFYIVPANEQNMLRVTPPKINLKSPIGAGDSTLAMYALFSAFETPIGPDQAMFLSAAGAATAEQTSSELGNFSRIFEIVNAAGENGLKVDTLQG